jgi:hypothetical protein
MNNLERRYRVLLKVLPEWYRQDREEEMVGLFLADRTDELDLEHSWPGWGETGAMLGLAVRTRLAATSAPVNAVRLGEVVRWLGVLGLLLGLTFLVPAVYGRIVQLSSPEFVPAPLWVTVSHFAPLVAIGLLVSGHRTWAKVVAGAALVPWLANVLTDDGPAGVTSVLWQLPALVTFVCLCLGFHREAPAPPTRLMLWWSGAAVLVGAGELLAWGTGDAVLAAVVLGVRIYAYVRGQVALGRALSIFAWSFAGGLVVSYVDGPPQWRGFVVVTAALWLVSAAAPVRRASVLGSRLP